MLYCNLYLKIKIIILFCYFELYFILDQINNKLVRYLFYYFLNDI